MKVYIGEFTEDDLVNGRDKEAINKALEKEELKSNGIKYIESELIRKKGKIVGIKVWLTDKF